MSTERYLQAEWLEWSGLPAALNGAKAGAWSVFKKLVELDCRRHRAPGAVEIPLAELAERCGLEPAAVARLVEVLRKRKLVRCYIPESHEEPALFEFCLPLATPLAPEEVARRTSDPLLRDTSLYRYTREQAQSEGHTAKVQAVVDLYLTHLSQKINSFVIEQIEIAARRFDLESIRRMMERGASHNLRTMGWVLKELIREESRRKKPEL